MMLPQEELSKMQVSFSQLSVVDVVPARAMYAAARRDGQFVFDGRLRPSCGCDKAL